MNNMNKGLHIRLLSAFLSALILLSCGTILRGKTISVSEGNNDHLIKIPEEVYIGGSAFGVKLYSDGLIIIGFSDVESANGTKSPAKDAGMEINDIITKINDHKIVSANDFTDRVENSNGNKIKLQYIRNDTVYECEVTPSLSETDGKYKMGLWFRDSTAGIGTVTFVIPGTGVFAGLGHGICDCETGALLPLSKGIVTDVKIEGIKKGACGAPGELQGAFTGSPIGTLLKNTMNGVCGIYFNEADNKQSIKIGTRNDIKDGSAYILCTLGNNGPEKFDISISDIHRENNGNKNFIITVTDKNLIEKTGGIVQGMSGSPIVQNGKLVGAVTHVLINDPTKGYGIFIDNMTNFINGSEIMEK